MPTIATNRTNQPPKFPVIPKKVGPPLDGMAHRAKSITVVMKKVHSI
jgi:hypothetical protein